MTHFWPKLFVCLDWFWLYSLKGPCAPMWTVPSQATGVSCGTSPVITLLGGGSYRKQALYLIEADGNRNTENCEQKVRAQRKRSEVGGCVFKKKKWVETSWPSCRKNS